MVTRRTAAGDVLRDRREPHERITGIDSGLTLPDPGSPAYPQIKKRKMVELSGCCPPSLTVENVRIYRLSRPIRSESG